MPNKPKNLYPKKNVFKTTYRDMFFGEIPERDDTPFQRGELTPYKKGQINRQIKEIIEQCTSFKIGVCGDVPIRMDDKKYRKKYDKVAVVYKTRQESRAIDYEVELIEKFMRLHPDKIDNISLTKANRLATYDYHYKIYVVYKSS